MKHLNLLLTLFLFSFFFKGFSQSALSKMKTKLELQKKLQTTSVKMTVINPSQAGILFSDNILTPDQSLQWLRTQLDLRQGVDELSPEGAAISTGEVTINKLHQYYKGIRVEHGVINTTTSNNKVAMMQMEYYSIDDNFNTTPVLSEQGALQKAIDFTGAYKYAWTDYKGNDPAFMLPRGELVIVRTYKNDTALCLAYKFEIAALYPFSREYVYVNAWDGTVVLNDPIIKHANRNMGKPATSYNKSSIAGYGGSLNSNPARAASITGGYSNNITDKIPPYGQAPYANVNGTADTRFLGRRTIVTDNNSGVPGRPYRLQQTRNDQRIITLNFKQKPYNTVTNYEAQAVDFTDNDNTWSAAEHSANMDDAALDVQFNMQIVSDYWKNVHNRNGWDNNNGDILSYVHVTENSYTQNGVYISTNFLPNAFWFRGNMHFGDGSGDFAASQPYNTLDICGHEMGHAITETTSSLVYQWESGALNESFSDIWAACITNYAKIHLANMSDETTWRVAEKCENLNKANKGFRDMSNPALFLDPSTYQNTFWKPATLPTCRDFGNTDNCGVHSNSGVLNKWFFLITDGENSFNSFGTIYNIKGLGFGTSQKIAYLTSINLPPNATYATAKTVSINAAATLYGSSSVEVKTVKEAWVAVAVDSNIYNMNNTQVFTGNNFTSIAVGKNGHVWAGTNYNGLYHYDGTAWEKRTEIPNVRINDIKADKAGNIWIAQSGIQASASMATGGGVNYLKTPYGPNDAYFYTIGAQTNVPSRNARCIYVDTSRVNDGSNPKVWVATMSYITSGNSTSGMLGQGLYSNPRYFLNVNEGLNIRSGTAGVLTVGGTSSEIWTFAQANYGINQLLVYNAGTNALITYYDHNTDPILPSGFVARAIYGDAKKRIWIALANNGLIVLDENKEWHYINNLPPSVYPPGTQANFNAIAGNKWGDVYIGTTNGILFFDRGDGLIDKIDNPRNYKLFTKANGLPSNQVNAIAYDTSRFKLMVATDSGVVFFEPLCVAPYCREYKANAEISSETTLSGNWSNPAIWSNNKLPDSLTAVSIKNNIVVDINAECRSLTVTDTGSVTIKSGKKLTLYEEKAEIIMGGQEILAGQKPVKSVGGKKFIRNIQGSIEKPLLPTPVLE